MRYKVGVNQSHAPLSLDLRALKEVYSGEAISLQEVGRLRILSTIISIPLRFFQEIELFAERNVIKNDPIVNKHPTSKRVCLRCFKAHLMVKIKELHLSPHTALFLISHFRSKIGHNRYYLDGQELIKMDFMS